MNETAKKDIEKIAKPGDVLAGKYLVDRVLGIGGMGAVVAATHTQLDQRVAIKFLLPAMLGSKEVVERFQREARAAAKIKSEHVVRVSDVGTLDGGIPYIVMEFLEGRDLGELLERRGNLPIVLAVDYILEACEALAEAHAAGIVHRDLKPSNLFLARLADDTDIIKVLDFGISKQVSTEALQSNPSLTKTTDVFGSPTYMSPEQLKASRNVDARADIWALGVILYELLTGAPPFGGGTVAEIFGAILHQPTPRIREVRKDAPAELERIILHCLEKEADKRFQNIAEFADALMPFGSESARESTARVSRILKVSGPNSRAAGSNARASLPDFDFSQSGKTPAVAAGTAVPSKTDGEGERAAGVGSATNTSWGNIKPTGSSSTKGRTLLIAGAITVAAAVGALVAFKFISPSGAAGAGSTLPVSEPVPGAGTPTTVVIPVPTNDPTASSSAPPSTSASAGSTQTPAITPAGPVPTSKLTGKVPATAAPTQTSQPTTKPEATKTPPPSTGDDDDFGGRK
ncbi:MAG: protein kinase [Polyangiaceae bacterium]|nr:protein kinase [Polyangiaceae bacterium]